MNEARQLAHDILQLHKDWGKRLHTDPEGAIACQDEASALVRAIVQLDASTVQIDLDSPADLRILAQLARFDGNPWCADLQERPFPGAGTWHNLRLGHRQAQAILWFAKTVLPSTHSPLPR